MQTLVFSHVLQYRFNILVHSLGSPSLIERLVVARNSLSVSGIPNPLPFRHTQVFWSYSFALSTLPRPDAEHSVWINSPFRKSVEACRRPGMVRIMGNRTNNAEWFLLLSSVGTTYCTDSSTVPNHYAMVQLPPKLWYLSKQENWKPVKDEIRGLTSLHGLAHIENGVGVEICFRHGNMYAICKFKHNDDTREVFSTYVEGFWFRCLLIVLDRTGSRPCIRGLCTASMVMRRTSKRP